MSMSEKVNSVHFDYEFVIKKFSGEKHYYIERYYKEFSDDELHESMIRIADYFDSAKTITLNKIHKS